MEVMTHASTFLLPNPPSNSPTYALIVLNQRLPSFTPLLWKQAQVRLCADGGSNRLFDGLPEIFPGQSPLDVRNRYKPDVIKGDMDSIRPEVMEFYSNLGTKIVDESHDQDTTDLHKCITFIRDSTPDLDKSNLCILVTGALGGRFDHEAGNINVLFKFSNIRIILLSDDCLIHLLPKMHQHEIHIQTSVEGPHCGLIPIGSPASSTTTTGLEWNLPKFHLLRVCLGGTEMKFGGIVIDKVQEETTKNRTDRKPPGVGRGRGRGREDGGSGRPSRGIGRGQDDGGRGMGAGRGRGGTGGSGSSGRGGGRGRG